ncbi:MAG: division/cell wall cluster transcriptional repressor MraZ [Clostridia bacterium]|nr:division/cell wall cluster transcriptional repressor MraZ [Clostridia bacterium]
MAFYGKHTHTLDAKNRLFVPAKYRPELGETFYIVPRLDSHLAIYTQEKWDKLIEKLNSYPDAKVEGLRRFIFSNSIDVTFDSHGRIMLSAELVAYAHIKKGAIIAGMGDYAEIWAEEEWQDKIASVNLEDLRELYSEF